MDRHDDLEAATTGPTWIPEDRHHLAVGWHELESGGYLYVDVDGPKWLADGGKSTLAETTMLSEAKALARWPLWLEADRSQRWVRHRRFFGGHPRDVPLGVSRFTNCLARLYHESCWRCADNAGIRWGLYDGGQCWVCEECNEDLGRGEAY